MISPYEAYKMVVHDDRGTDWDPVVLPGPTGVMVFPVEDDSFVVTGEAPVFVTEGGLEYLPSNADVWPEWYWRSCEDEKAWVDTSR